MSFLDRFRRPVKYVLQMKKGKGFETLAEYDPKDYPVPPTEQSVIGDMEDEDIYHRLISIYPSGNNKIVWEHAGKRKAKAASGKFDISQLPQEIDKAMAPIKSVIEAVNTINQAFSELKGTGEQLTKDDVREVLREEGKGGMDFQMPPAPGWIWWFHPYVRQGFKDTVGEVERMLTSVGTQLMEKAMGKGAEPSAEAPRLPGLGNIIDEELAHTQETQESAQEKSEDEKEEGDDKDESP